MDSGASVSPHSNPPDDHRRGSGGSQGLSKAKKTGLEPGHGFHPEQSWAGRAEASLRVPAADKSVEDQ